MKKIQLSILFILLVFLAACSGDHPTTPTTQPAEIDAETPLSSGAAGDEGEVGKALLPEKQQVVENCRLLQTAAEVFAAGNGGVYPADLNDTTPQGLTVVDLLPGGALSNPFTGSGEAPRDGVADAPGAVGYVAVFRDARPRGYWITGTGATAGVSIVTIVKAADGAVTETIGRSTPGPDEHVLDNCLAVQAAVEAWAADNNGEYPWNLASTNRYDDTMIDHLPDRRLLTNPYTLCATEPVEGAGVNAGSTSYQAVDSDGDGTADGYRIEGLGADVAAGPMFVIATDE